MFPSSICIAALVASLASSATAICPGYNFGIGQQYDNAGLPSWHIYNDDCTVHEPVTLRQGENPCSTGIFGCTPDPVTFNSYISSRTSQTYACRADPAAGTCGSDAISVCCRNDGN